MLAFPYTEHDTPESRARIGHDLETIIEHARDGDPAMVALVLTGGFSRGEGTLRDGAPVNDYDLIAVRSRPGGPAAYARLGHALTERIGLEVDIMPIWRARLPHVAPKLFWLDVLLGARVLWGDTSVLQRLPHFTARDVPPREAARLLGNRAAGLLLALPGPNQPIDVRLADLQATKAALAAMDATLLAEGNYAARLRERLAISSSHPDHAIFARAVQWKTGGSHPPLGAAWWHAAAGALLRAVDQTNARMAPDSLPERGYHAWRAMRLRAHPSRRVREASWTLLGSSRFPEGPSVQDAKRALAPLGFVEDCADWPQLKARYFALRARTLQ
ncbi:MAG: hypothetical protein WDA16_05345 [Candidatus Thermoplasmatota archaeon]